MNDVESNYNLIIKQKNPNTESVRILVTRTRIELMITPWKGVVLTSWPTGLIMVAAVRLELTTYRVWTGCSSQLSHAAIYNCRKASAAFLLFSLCDLIIIALKGLCVNSFFKIFSRNFAFCHFIQLKVEFQYLPIVIMHTESAFILFLNSKCTKTSKSS